MRYIQHKSGQKLHLVFEVENSLTQPICGRKFDNYRMSINVPLGNSCKKCNQRLNSKNFDSKEFIKLCNFFNINTYKDNNETII